MAKSGTYIGLDKENNGGMTAIGKIIRDAWVFGLIEETQTCEGWNAAGIDSLMEKVNNCFCRNKIKNITDIGRGRKVIWVMNNVLEWMIGENI